MKASGCKGLNAGNAWEDFGSRLGSACCSLGSEPVTLLSSPICAARKAGTRWFSRARGFTVSSAFRTSCSGYGGGMGSGGRLETLQYQQLPSSTGPPLCHLAGASSVKSEELVVHVL